MSGKSSRSSLVAGAVLVTVNFLTMVVCALLFAAGLWTVSSPRTLSNAIQNTGSAVLQALLPLEVLSVQLGVAVAVLAAFIFFVSLMGYQGAINRSPFTLFMYTALVVLLLLLECALLYYFTSSVMEKGLQERDGQWTHALRLAFRCCDRNETILSPAGTLPWSCCGADAYPLNCTLTNMYRKDCQRTMSGWLVRQQAALYASLVSLHTVLASCAVVRRRS